MSGEQWGEAVDAAAHAIDAACDSANVDGAWRLEDDAEYYDMPGVFAQEAATFARAAIEAAAPLIVADTRRKVADGIRLLLQDLDPEHWAEAVTALEDALHVAENEPDAAIARGGGNGDSDTSKPTGSQPI